MEVRTCPAIGGEIYSKANCGTRNPTVRRLALPGPGLLIKMINIYILRYQS